MNSLSLYLKFKNKNEQELNEALLISCRCGNLEEVKFLLTSNDLNIHASPRSFDHAGLSMACSGGHLEVVKYLLTSSELKQHADLHANENDYIHTPFVNAASTNQLNILYYFILELNIEKRKYIDDFFNKFPNEQLENLFSIRDVTKNDSIDLQKHKQRFKL